MPFDPDSTKTLDLCLFVNGIRIATAELKNHLTGQSIEHAIEQYRTDRAPRNVTPGRRALVHFAVDPDLVCMTTKLEAPVNAVPAVQPGARPGRGEPTEPARPQDVVSVGARVEPARLAGHPSPLHPRRATRARLARVSACGRTGDLSSLPPVGRCDQTGDGRARGWFRALQFGSALGWLRKSNTIAWTSHGSRRCTTHRTASCSTR
ncbi:MAG: type I restriction endonuclease [Solirubrobacteraceae bacterium]